MSWRIVIPSASAENLIACVRAIMACEPDLPPASIIVIDDGARAESEPVLPPVTWVTGERPFIFARNVNHGLSVAGTDDVIVLGDDGRLVTPSGFTLWAAEMRRRSGVGVCSAGIHGLVCNPRQIARVPATFRDEPTHLAFVCVYLSRAAIDRVGVLDEQFVGYGFDDFDYCRRVRAAGLGVAIWDGCVIHHVGVSAYRTRPDWPDLYARNHQIYREKWAGT